jgi:peptidoglycan/xylan/chitin deacetylase (PgdA/CDA1 family)
MRLALLFAFALVLAACAPTGDIGGHSDGGGGGDDDDDGPDPGQPDASEPPDPDDPDAGPPDPDQPDSGPVMPVDGLGAWTGNDDVPPSPQPPFGLPVDAVPQFVSIGFDDNAYSGLDGSAGTGGMSWASDMIKGKHNPDGSQAYLTFYMTSIYIGVWQSESPTFVKRSWHQAYTDGNEIGNHTYGHNHGSAYTETQWDGEIQTCIDWLIKPFDPNEVNFSPDDSKGAGVPAAEIYGFRTPFLEYNDATLAVVDQKGFWYDCSIEDGWQYDQDGTNYLWPYTLDNGSPGHEVLVEWGSKAPITPHPGLWEMPVHPVVVPPDSECANYGVPPGLRAKMQGFQSWFDVQSGKITGFDYNLWVSFKMTKAEWLATMKYTLDLRLAGNRAPLMFGAHTDYYSSKYTGAPNSTPDERREAMEAFIDYALSKPEVRVLSTKQILDWVRNPVPL